jgi:hypothetical protein
MSLVERLIDLTFTKLPTPQNPNRTFEGTDTNTVKVSGLRTSVTILKAGGQGLSQAQVRVFGMPLSIMNQLSTLGKPLAYTITPATITIEAGDSQNGMSVVFQGNITQAWADFNSAPEVSFNILAFVGALIAAAPTAASSFPGAADVATILAGLATRAGLNFENNGVNVKLASPYFPGSLMAQISACADAAGISHIIDNGTLAIWPANGSRHDLAPLISPETGLVGYPAYTGQGIALRTLYNPSVGYGSEINVESILTPACGTWVVNRLAYDLESKVPDGNWFCDIEAAQRGIVQVVTR